MKKVIINENQRGLLFKNAKYIKLLEAGKYRIGKNKEIELLDIRKPFYSQTCHLETLLTDNNFAEKVSVVEVNDEQLALHFVNGKFSGVLASGKYAFWKIHDKHEYQFVDISTPEVNETVPTHVFQKISPYFFTKVEVNEYQKALVYFDKKFVRILEAGTYYFWNGKTEVETITVDTRLTQMNITGQEILTRDKVSLRINFVCNYRITDYITIHTEIDNFGEQLHILVQLALREYVSKYKLDDILDSKEEMSQYVFERLKAKESELFVEITSAGVKDIILPGNIRDIMNTVLIAEKRAQANVITRREEVASTRSLLNTAKLMEENQTLYKLKELEFVEKICENVGNINLGGNSDILTQLTSLLRKDAS